MQIAAETALLAVGDFQDLLLEGLLVGDLANGADEAHHRAVIPQWDVREGEPADRSICGDPGALLIRERAARTYRVRRLLFDFDDRLFGPDLGEPVTEHGLALLLQRVEQRAIHDRQAILRIGGVNDLRKTVDERSEEQALFFQRRFGLTTFTALASFRQCAIDDGRQALQTILQDVISGAALQRFDGAFLAERAGDEDEGHVRGLLKDELECREPVEAGQRVICEHQIGRRIAAQGFHEFLFRPDMSPVDGHFVARELEPNQLGIVRIVLEQDETQRCGFLLHTSDPWLPVRDPGRHGAKLSLCCDCGKVMRLWKMWIAVPVRARRLARRSHPQHALLVM